MGTFAASLARQQCRGRPPETPGRENARGEASRVNVAARDDSHREERVLRRADRRTQSVWRRRVIAVRRRLDPRHRVRVKAAFRSARIGGGLQKRNPTAVQSGNRQAALLGERSRRRQSRSTVCMRASAKIARMLSGPRRAQAGSRLAARIGPRQAKAHAVRSRLTSWAFCFFARVDARCDGENRREGDGSRAVKKGCMHAGRLRQGRCHQGPTASDRRYRRFVVIFPTASLY
jgi:hypothetical protein